MKTALILLTAIVVPGGLALLAAAWLGRAIARRRTAKPVLSGPLIP